MHSDSLGTNEPLNPTLWAVLDERQVPFENFQRIANLLVNTPKIFGPKILTREMRLHAEKTARTRGQPADQQKLILEILTRDQTNVETYLRNHGPALQTLTGHETSHLQQQVARHELGPLTERLLDYSGPTPQLAADVLRLIQDNPEFERLLAADYYQKEEPNTAEAEKTRRQIEDITGIIPDEFPTNTLPRPIIHKCRPVPPGQFNLDALVQTLIQEYTDPSTEPNSARHNIENFPGFDMTNP